MGPLAGRRVVVTRAPEDAGALVAALDARGAESVVFPTIARLPPPDPDAVKRAWSGRGGFDRVLCGSAAALEAFAELERPDEPIPVACVGDATAREVEARFGGRFVVAEVAETRRAEGLLFALEQSFGDLEGRKFLFPRAPEGRLVLVEALEARGAAVEAVLTYRIGCAPPAPPALVASLEGADAFTFLSGQTLACFLDAAGPSARLLLERAVVAVIGPVAAERAATLGVRVDVVPAVASADALAEALARSMARPGRS